MRIKVNFPSIFRGEGGALIRIQRNSWLVHQFASTWHVSIHLRHCVGFPVYECDCNRDWLNGGPFKMPMADYLGTDLSRDNCNEYGPCHNVPQRQRSRWIDKYGEDSLSWSIDHQLALHWWNIESTNAIRNQCGGER